MTSSRARAFARLNRQLMCISSGGLPSAGVAQVLSAPPLLPLSRMAAQKPTAPAFFCIEADMLDNPGTQLTTAELRDLRRLVAAWCPLLRNTGCQVRMTR